MGNVVKNGIGARTSWDKRALALLVLAGVAVLVCLGVWVLGRPAGRVKPGGEALAAGDRLAAKPEVSPGLAAAPDEGDVEVGARGGKPAFALPADRAGLLRVLRDRSAETEVRCAAADKLRQLRAKESAGLLLEILQDKSEPLSLRYKAARAVGVVGDESAEAVLASLAAEQGADRHLRVVSVLALGNFGDSNALNALAQAEQDPDSLIRFKAVQALETKDTVAGREIVEKALGDSDIYVQARAIQTLGKIGGQPAVRTIDGVLQTTESDFIRIACLTALGNSSRPEAVAILSQYENNTNQLLSANARAALQRVKQGQEEHP